MDDLFYRLECYDMVEDEYSIWFASESKNILCEMEKETKNIKILAELEKGRYSSIEKIGENLVLIPNSASRIAVCNLPTMTISYIELKSVEDNKYYVENSKFWNSFSYGNDVYMLPLTYPAIVKLNVVSMEIEYLTEWMDLIENQISENETEMKYFMDSMVIDSAAWISCGSSNVMVCFDLNSYKFLYFKIKTSLSGFGVFSFDGVNFWIAEQGKQFNKLICWNPNSEIIEEISLFTNQEKKYCPIHMVLNLEKKILVFPYINSSVYEVDKKTKEVNECKNLKECFSLLQFKEWEFQTLAIKKQDSIVRFITGNNFMWYEYNLEKQKYINYEVKLDKTKEDVKKLMKKIFSDIFLKKKENELLIEGEIPLQYYIILDFLHDSALKKKQMKKQTRGELIYGRIKWCNRKEIANGESKT